MLMKIKNLIGVQTCRPLSTGLKTRAERAEPLRARITPSEGALASFALLADGFSLVRLLLNQITSLS